MSEQMIISIGREFGSGGREIAGILSQRFHISLYDSNLLQEVAVEKNIDMGKISKYDEVPRNRLFSRTVNGYSNSVEENIANMQFEYLKKLAERGESFVVLGRCAESVLKDYPGLISIFILADMDCKIKRISAYDHISEAEAEYKIIRCNKRRKQYHNYYCKGKWGDSRNYDISINSSVLGIEATADMLEDFIRRRFQKQN